MELIFIIGLIIAMLIAFTIILYEYNSGKYNVENSLIEEKSLEDYQKDYPSKTTEELKIEIEKIADRLIDNLKSNRYTEKIRKKAEDDEEIRKLKNQIVDNVKIINYKDKKLKARVDYNLEDLEYSLIFDMITVNRGRVFLKKYKLMKQKLKKEFIF